MTLISPRASHASWALVLTAFLGCAGEGSGLPVVPVEGIVSLDGKPLSGAVVTLIPVGETRGQGGYGRTDAEGKFTVQSRDGDGKGAVVGNYQVVISKYVNDDGSDFTGEGDVSPMDAGADEKLPPKYSDQQYSKLQAQVPEGGAKLEFKLTSK